MDAKEVRTALEAKGVKLGVPAGSENLKQFESSMQLTMDRYLRQIYAEFDGFTSYDERSQIILWPLDRILQCRSMSLEKRGEKYFAVGDFLIDSDFLMCCLQRESAPIFFLYEEREVATAASEFFRMFISGEFDFFCDR